MLVCGCKERSCLQHRPQSHATLRLQQGRQRTRGTLGTKGPKVRKYMYDVEKLASKQFDCEGNDIVQREPEKVDVVS